MATESGAVAAITVAGMFGAKLYGISMDDVFLASIPTMMGALGRVGFEMARAADPQSTIKWSAVAYLFGGTLVSCPTVAVLGLILLQLTHTTSDPAIMFGFVFAGFMGPKSIIWGFNSASNMLNRTFNWKLPQIGPSGEDIKP